MTGRAPLLLAAGVGALALGAAGVVAAGARRSVTAAAGSREFQALAGGLGLGRAIDLARCGESFDPRAQSPCEQRHGPIPAGCAFCPRPHPPCGALGSPAGQAVR